MRQIYCDSNIFRLIKPIHRAYNSELREAMDALKDKFSFVYSEAHLDDLKSSDPLHRNNDLIFMEQYVRDRFYRYNLIGKRKLEILNAVPKDAYEMKDYNASSNALENPFDLDHVFKDLMDIPGISDLLDKLKKLYSLSISSFGGLQKFQKWMKSAKNKWMHDSGIPSRYDFTGNDDEFDAIQCGNVEG